MIKRLTSFTLFIVIMGIVLITLMGCSSNNTIAGSSENNISIFIEVEVYAITCEFDDHSYGGIGFGWVISKNFRNK